MLKPVHFQIFTKQKKKKHRKIQKKNMGKLKKNKENIGIIETLENMGKHEKRK